MRPATLPIRQTLYAIQMKYAIGRPMTPEEKRERARAAYARDPEKYRALARENRRKPGAAERHKELAKDWALRNAEHVKARRKAKYEQDRQANIEKARVWKARNPARVLASQRSRASINRDKMRGAQSVGEEEPDGGIGELQALP